MSGVVGMEVVGHETWGRGSCALVVRGIGCRCWLVQALVASASGLVLHAQRSAVGDGEVEAGVALRRVSWHVLRMGGGCDALSQRWKRSPPAGRSEGARTV